MAHGSFTDKESSRKGKKPALKALVYIVLGALVLLYPFIKFQIGSFGIDLTHPYPIHLLILVCLYAMTAQAWNILAGYCGQVSFGHAAYFGLGAYTSTMLLLHFRISPWIGMLGGAGAAILLALLVGIPSFRLKGHYFAIATLAVAETVQMLFINWDLAGEAKGLWLPVLKDGLGNFQWKAKLPYYYVILSMLCFVYLATYWMERSKLGFYFRAIRDDPVASGSLGVNGLKYKLVALSMSAAFSALGGTFYAQYILFIDPFSVLQMQQSVMVVLLATFGGIGTYWGPIIGAAILVPISEAVRIRLGGGGGAEDLIVYGSLIILITLIEPTGIVGIYRKHVRPRLFPSTGTVNVHAMADAAAED